MPGSSSRSPRRSILWYLLFRTTFGYQIRTVGLSRGAAAYAGIKWGSTITLAMFLSGCLAGLAGAGEALGLHGRHYANRQATDSPRSRSDWSAATIPIGVIFAGLLFGVLRSGSNAMQNQVGTSKELVLILQALVILSVSALASLEYLRERRARTAAATPSAAAQPATGVTA